MSVRDLIFHCVKQRLVLETQTRRDRRQKKRRTRDYRNFRTLSVSSKNELIAKLVLDRKKSSQKISRLLKRVAFWKAKVRSLREEIAKIKDSKVQNILDSITNPQVSFFSPFLTDISKAAEFNFS